MYSWACLFITLTAIYAYRFYKSVHEENYKMKNLILFGIFSICSCYMHYYALVAAGLMNIILLVYLIKTNKQKNALKHFIILIGIQIIIYLPWLICFAVQLIRVNNGYWIKVKPIGTALEVISAGFGQEANGDFIINTKNIVALVISCLLYIYLIFKIFKDRKNLKPAIVSLGIYIGVIAIIAIISIKTPLLNARYLSVVMGIYVFTISYILSKESNKILTFGICFIVLVLGINHNIQMIQDNYDKSNDDLYEYLGENLKENDVIASINIDVTALTSLRFPNYKHYFLTPEYKEQLKAFEPEMIMYEDYEFLEDVKGRVWMIVGSEEENIDKDSKIIKTKYFGYTYYIKLFDR